MIIFDTETTGFAKANIVSLDKQPRIIEFAAIKLDDKTLEEKERIEFLVNPGVPIPFGASKVNKIYDKDVKDEKPFMDYYLKLVKFFFGEKFLIAHNVAFDVNMLKFELQRLGRLTQFPWPPVQICTVTQTMSLCGYRLKQSKLYDYLFKCDFEGAHRAMGDVEALVRITKELIKREIIKI